MVPGGTLFRGYVSSPGEEDALLVSPACTLVLKGSGGGSEVDSRKINSIVTQR